MIGYSLLANSTPFHSTTLSTCVLPYIFAGYQIAFAHKRISDVAPVLIGGVLIGAAGQIAKMLVANGGSCGAQTASVISQLIGFFA